MIMHNFLLYFFSLLLGLVLGSFLNVLTYRYLNGGSVIAPRSSCPSCKTPLKALDLIPLFSFLILRGKCRYCRKKISIRYPLVELLTGIVFVTCFHYFGLGPYFWKYIIIFSILIVISAIDLENNLIPNRFVLVLLAWVFLWQLFYPDISHVSAALGFLAGGLSFFLIAILSRGGMGGGDVKLMAVLGLAAGWPHILMLFLLAFVMGAMVGIGFLISKKKSRKDSVPFGPFLALALYVITFWGQDIWMWYTSFL